MTIVNDVRGSAPYVAGWQGQHELSREDILRELARLVEYVDAREMDRARPVLHTVTERLRALQDSAAPANHLFTHAKILAHGA